MCFLSRVQYLWPSQLTRIDFPTSLSTDTSSTRPAVSFPATLSLHWFFQINRSPLGWSSSWTKVRNHDLFDTDLEEDELSVEPELPGVPAILDSTTLNTK